MHLLLVTSLDGLSRTSAAFSLAAESPEIPVVLQDLLDEGVVVRRVHLGEQLIERESMTLEHGCLGCTVRFDLAPTLLRLAEQGIDSAIVGLPPGTTAQNAIDGLHAVAPGAFVIDTVCLAAVPDDVEDQLWDHHTLFESGYTAVSEDGRTPGEFLIGELLFADTILATTNHLLPPDPDLLARGVQLIGELAPHAHLIPAFATVSRTELGAHDLVAATARSRPGVVLPVRPISHPAIPLPIDTTRGPLTKAATDPTEH